MPSLKETSSKKSKTPSPTEREIATSIAGKIMDYKQNLNQLPPKLISFPQAEKDRQFVNNFYHFITHSSTQLLDAKFYSQLLHMQRQRDKAILQEGTTHKERLSILARSILHLTTPVLFLNHDRGNIIIKDFWIGLEERSRRITFNDSPVKEKLKSSNVNLPPINEKILLQIKKKLIMKLKNKKWSLEKLNSNLNHWEADILSQMSRDFEVIIEILGQNLLKINFLKQQVKNPAIRKVKVILLEPSNEY